MDLPLSFFFLQSLGSHVSINDSVSSLYFSHELQIHRSGCLTGTPNSARPKQNSHCIQEGFMGQPEDGVHHSVHSLHLELSHMAAQGSSSKGGWEME